MSGNVWQWMADCWNETYAGAPTDGSGWQSGLCERRVLRAGAWGSNPLFGRSAYRIRVLSGDRSVNHGFRVARTL